MTTWSLPSVWIVPKWVTRKLISVARVIERQETLESAKSLLKALFTSIGFEMEDGKIKVWRDYFDLNTFRKAME
ncbi:MAG TPA: hypothetical protein EYQ00_09700 [Dehalococcoidia bacterium]|nr:hypothetical protein [Dehalococcoidia bacterium]